MIEFILHTLQLFDVIPDILLIIPYILEISLSLAVGLVTIYFFGKTGKFGLALISAAFFLNTVLGVVNLATGPYFILWLRDLGYSTAEIGAISFSLFLVKSTFKIAFATVVIAGIFKLSQQA